MHARMRISECRHGRGGRVRRGAHPRQRRPYSARHARQGRHDVDRPPAAHRTRHLAGVGRSWLMVCFEFSLLSELTCCMLDRHAGRATPASCVHSSVFAAGAFYCGCCGSIALQCCMRESLQLCSHMGCSRLFVCDRRMQSAGAVGGRQPAAPHGAQPAAVAIDQQCLCRVRSVC